LGAQRTAAGEAGALLRGGNCPFVPASELRIVIYLDRKVFLAFLTGVWVGFINNPFSNPASRSARMPAAFFQRAELSVSGVFLTMPSNPVEKDRDWDAEATEALEAARPMPPGPEKIEALKRAGLLRKTAAAST
jgi:hypothetical protein